MIVTIQTPIVYVYLVNEKKKYNYIFKLKAKLANALELYFS